MKGIGPFELILIFGILLLIFGATRLAGIGKAVGTSIKEFKKGMKDSDDEKPTASNVDTAKTIDAPKNDASNTTKTPQH